MRHAVLALILTAALAGGASASAPWRLTPEGVGPVRLGMTIDQAIAAVHPLAVDTAPAEAQGCQEFRVDGPTPFHFLAEQGRVARVSVTETGLTTARGIGPGDAEAAVRRAYGPGLINQPASFDDLPAHDLVFWASPGHGFRFEIGQDGKVLLIHAGGKAIQYVEGCE